MNIRLKFNDFILIFYWTNKVINHILLLFLQLVYQDIGITHGSLLLPYFAFLH